MIEIGRSLATAIERALPSWVERCVEGTVERAGMSYDESLRRKARDAGRRCAVELGPRLRFLLDQDLDEQTTTPLSLVREGVVYPTALLVEFGVAPARRDDFLSRLFPDDPYALTPASLAVLGDEVGELAITWGAAKAFEHLKRHRPS